MTTAMASADKAGDRRPAQAVQSGRRLGDARARFGRCGVEGMRWAPFTWKTVLHLAATTLLPVLPLTLTMFSAQQVLDRLLKILV